ncbi:hypothetical protein Calag_0789 [Caldisphaera lagunensis DSM 15908]|uniref:Uncharacterized protein n=1 Tax=Caldisphaera lagunensis (strain DSM 15908 / JCM 11604 / ANMR 0165 / IC-154) TaxID=1056495 RepID=L0A9I5_CALLD|nr:hypothetical protein [Caldisphaera lagunensis]AFZ70531.1 hypothetical protein Calag_0789 [Caldisphaera lagunensis DSM 15908]
MAKSQKSKEQKFKAIVQWFKKETIDLEEISFDGYKLINVEEIESKEDPLNFLYNLAEEKRKEKKGDFFVINVESLETKYVFADGVKDRGRLLYNIPIKLKRVGLIKKNQLKMSPEGYFIFKNDDIKWIDISNEIYIYYGTLKANDDIELVVLDTEKDKRIIKTQHLSMMKLSSPTPEQQNQSDHNNENELDEDNNPS